MSVNGIELMKSMLMKDPLKRCSATQALNHTWFVKMKTRDFHLSNAQGASKLMSLSTVIEKSEIDNSIIDKSYKTKDSSFLF